MKKTIAILWLFSFISLYPNIRNACAEYIIGEEDEIQVSVWENPELSAKIPVRPDGMISLPLVGDVNAAGLTPQELKVLLEKSLGRFVKKPVVSVVITEVNSYKVYVFGDGVARTQTAGASPSGPPSGQISLRRNTTLLQLLAQLGSISSIDLRNAYMLRDGKKLVVNFEQIVAKGDAANDILLKSNDIIYLPGSFNNHVRVIGAVKTPGVIVYSEGMTALDAVLSAGGFTEFASLNNVLIVRNDANSRKNIKARLKDVVNGNTDRNVVLKPGDIVNVKTGIF